MGRLARCAVTTSVSIGLVVAGTLAMGASAAATSCGVIDDLDVRVVTAELVEIDGDHARIQVVGADDTTLIRIHGRASALDVGETYVVPLIVEGDGEPPDAILPEPDDCGGPYITHLDGEVVDTAFFSTPSARGLGWSAMAIVAVGAAVVAVVTVVRRRSE